MPMQGRSFQLQAARSDGRQRSSGQVIGEYTLEMKNEQAHAKLQGLAI